MEEEKDSEKKSSSVVTSKPLKYEPNPDPRTLSPLLVDITRMADVLRKSFSLLVRPTDLSPQTRALWSFLRGCQQASCL